MGNPNGRCQFFFVVSLSSVISTETDIDEAYTYLANIVGILQPTFTIQSCTRLTKVLGEDRASTSEPEGHSEKATPLPEILNYRISLSTHRIGTSKDRSALKQRASKDSHKGLSEAEIPIGEDSSDEMKRCSEWQ